MTKERAIRMALLALILWSSPFIIASMVYSAQHYSLPKAENVAPAPSELPPPPPAPASPEEH